MAETVQRLYFHHLRGPQTQLRGKEQRSRRAREEVSHWEPLPLSGSWFQFLLEAICIPFSSPRCSVLVVNCPILVKVRLNLFQLFEKGNTRCKPYNHKINQNCAMKRTQTPDSGRSKLVSLKMSWLVCYPRLGLVPCLSNGVYRSGYWESIYRVPGTLQAWVRISRTESRGHRGHRGHSGGGAQQEWPADSRGCLRIGRTLLPKEKPVASKNSWESASV